jgi:uncharacterized protein (TIGR02996 family)
MHEEALLRAIFDAPEDDAPRLIYADWLEERGDADRAEFIRVQCELARLPPDDEGRAGLEARERSLLEDHSVDWSAPLFGMGTARVFRRGFVDEVTMSVTAFFREAADLLRLAPIRRLQLYCDSPVTEGTTSGEMRSALPAMIGPSPLRELELRCAALSIAPVRDLLALPCLSRLTSLRIHFSGPYIHPVSRDQLVEQLGSLDARPALAELDLSGNGLTDRDAVALAASLWSHLRNLNLSGNQIRNEGIGALAASPNFPQLSVLRLGGNWMNAAGLRALLGTAHLPLLTVLDLSSSSQIASGLRGLPHSPLVARLTLLDLSRCRLGLAGVVGFLAAGPYESLTNLGLAGNDMGDKGLRALATSPHLPRLTALSLSDNTTRVGGVAALARSPLLAQLDTLHLDDNLVGSAGAQVLASSPHAARLCQLSLANNAITDAGAQALVDSPHLGAVTRLELARNPIGKKVQRLLEERFGPRVFLR